MANLLPEVQPVVSSMPDKGYDLQTGGSARRSFIKNNDDTYYIHGVPGHTHNASAMISVTAEYSRKRGIVRTIGTAWANEPVVMAAEDYTDSIEPRDKEERYNRAIERGIGRIIMIPENTNHMIEEPVRSISEIRTIVSPKDQLKTLTYINNVHGDGWVDPVTGTAGAAFNRDEPVLINFYSYEGVPRLEQDAAGQGTMRQPVYVANPADNTIRYAITGAGSEDAAGAEPWDGNVEFYWDEDSRKYYSKGFTKYFPAYELPTVVNVGAVEPTGQGAAIARGDFQVEFGAYETSKAEDGFCVFSEHDALVVSKATATTGQKLIPKIKVQVVYADIKMFSVAYWYGPPAFRIPVGGTRAIPGPPRQQANNYPSTYADQNSNTLENCEPFFRILGDLTDLQYQARAYDKIFTSRIAVMKAGEFPVKQVAPGNPGLDATNSNALKDELWARYLRPFGYGEAKLPLPNSVLRTSRHGFSSFLKYENSPYRFQSMYSPTSFPASRSDESDFTCDGVIPYPFIQPLLVNNAGAVDIDWNLASYQSGQNINALFNLFPEEELFECRERIGALPAGWAQLSEELRSNFYGEFEMNLAVPQGTLHIEWRVDTPLEASTHLFRHPRDAPVNPWTDANTNVDPNSPGGGSDEYHKFCFQRLYRTFAQFKKDPSNVLDDAIAEGAQADFEELHKHRVGAPALYLEFVTGDPVTHSMQTFPFRVLCHQTYIEKDDEDLFEAVFRGSIETLVLDGNVHSTLVDTTGAGIAADAWRVQSFDSVERNLSATQVPSGVYPFEHKVPHPKYAPFLHNAIGNLFEIRDYDTTSATHLVLRDIYWEAADFTDSAGVPTIMLVFNNYGADFDNPTEPKAYHLNSNNGVTALIDRNVSGTGPTENNQVLGTQNMPPGTGTGLNRVNMSIPYAELSHKDDNNARVYLTKNDVLQFVQDVPPGAPKMAIFVHGKTHVERFHDKNYQLLLDASKERGKVHRSDIKISQHLCSPVLNPDMRLSCIAPLNYASRHLPPEMRDFQLHLRDVDFSFLQSTSTPVLGDLVLSEFNGGNQQIAAQESLLYLPNFIEFKAAVQPDMTFSVDCMTGKGVPGYLCVFCRDSDNVLDQPIIKRLSLQNLTTMKKSNSVVDTDVHELYHMTQRNVHPRSEYDSKAFNRRQTLLFATEDVGLLGMEAKHYQRQKRVQFRVSGLCTNEGTVTVIFIYNNRGLYVKGRQQSVVHM